MKQKIENYERKQVGINNSNPTYRNGYAKPYFLLQSKTKTVLLGTVKLKRCPRKQQQPY